MTRAQDAVQPSQCPCPLVAVAAGGVERTDCLHERTLPCVGDRTVLGGTLGRGHDACDAAISLALTPSATTQREMPFLRRRQMKAGDIDLRQVRALLYRIRIIEQSATRPPC